MSWIPRSEGYVLAMNRDERRSRAPALAPREVSCGGIPALIPVDGEAGGSWISSNGLGHTLALLNRHEDSPLDSSGSFVSRGLLLVELAGLPGPESVDRALAGRPLASYRPFTLASVAPGSTPWLFEWDGRTLERGRVRDPGMVRTSSGRDQSGAERIRGGLFREAGTGPGGLTAEHLLALHQSHLPERGALSICMHREEAETVSCSLITVSESLVLFRYFDGPPGDTTQVSEFSLLRRNPAQR